MTVRRASDTIDKWIGLSTDQRPAAANIGSFFINDDNNNVYIMLKNGWTLLGSGGVGNENALLIDGSRDSEGLQTFQDGVVVYGETTLENGPVAINSNITVQGRIWFTPTNTHDIGSFDGSSRPRDANFGRDLYVGRNARVVGDIEIDGFSQFTGPTTVGSFLQVVEYLELREMTAPANPGVNRARLYLDDSGGKTRLMIKFPSGVAIQLAIEV